LNEKLFEGSKVGEEALKDFQTLFNYLENLGCTDSVLFDLSLARGLDYYTGVIYEAVLEGAGVGSIAGGGRYDELVGMFSGKNIPAVGFSIGIERIFAILEKKFEDQGSIRASETEVVVGSLGPNMLFERWKLVNELWRAGIRAEIVFAENPKSDKQLGYANDNFIPFIVWIGENEIQQGKVNVKVIIIIISLIY
jgi:histidyl-tRNA synthetase